MFNKYKLLLIYLHHLFQCNDPPLFVLKSAVLYLQLTMIRNEIYFPLHQANFAQNRKFPSSSITLVFLLLVSSSSLFRFHKCSEAASSFYDVVVGGALSCFFEVENNSNGRFRGQNSKFKVCSWFSSGTSVVIVSVM